MSRRGAEGSAARAVPRAVLTSALWLCVACAAPERPWQNPSAGAARGPRPYEAISRAGVDELRVAVLELERGDLGRALADLQRVVDAAPDDLRAAIWFQEAELALAEDRARRLGLALEGSSSPSAQLRRRARRAAEQEPSPRAWFLAARLEDDAPAAKLLLERALELDPEMSWAHYGLAHAAARDGDWGGVQRELARTFELEPGHLPALRLYAWTQATAGDLALAIDAYEAWLARADEDLLATPKVIAHVRLDLALAYLAADEPRRAMTLLDRLAQGDGTRGAGREEPDERVRLASARAAALQALGRAQEAREAAAVAEAADRKALLPVVQEALLRELWLGDPNGAREAWRRVLELSASEVDLGAGLQRFRAQVHLERLSPRGTP